MISGSAPGPENNPEIFPGDTIFVERTGIVYVVGMFKTSRHVKGEETDWKRAIISATAGPLLSLGVGYLIHLKIS